MTESRVPGCFHPNSTKMIEKLGLMTAKPDGTVSAPVLEWSLRCDDCHEVLATHKVPYGAGQQMPLGQPVQVVLP